VPRRARLTTDRGAKGGALLFEARIFLAGFAGNERPGAGSGWLATPGRPHAAQQEGWPHYRKLPVWPRLPRWG